LALIDDVGAGPVGVDTAIFIYFIEEHERFLPVIAPLFAAADAGKFELVASALTLLEVLVVPFRAGNIGLAERYEAMLTGSPGVRLEISAAIIFVWPPRCGRRAALPLPMRCSSLLRSQPDARPSSPTIVACQRSRGCGSFSSAPTSFDAAARQRGNVKRKETVIS
jgi:hypothetical protein